jgi:dTDP-4-amino-4,6-dideoxygalactose transaminase
LQKAFAFLCYQSGQMPVAEAASHEVLSLPVYPELTDQQQDKVVKAIENFYLHDKSK